MSENEERVSDVTEVVIWGPDGGEQLVLEPADAEAKRVVTLAWDDRGIFRLED